MDCKTGFIAPLIDFNDLSYARCPVCHRMDLNGWTGKTYTDPPFWVKLKVSLGASKWRCEYCRLNFASFRRRKEIFTFKRWKRYVPQAEERDANNAKVELIAGPYGDMLRNAVQTPEPDADSTTETE